MHQAVKISMITLPKVFYYDLKVKIGKSDVKNQDGGET